MPGTREHATLEAGKGGNPPRRDHLWVLFVIAACVLAEVWASWVGIGSISGFPEIGHIPTDWVLAVAMEAYWGYALYAWLVASPGPRSRAMAMWSCGAVFVLSLIGQVLYHEITAPAGMPPGKRVVIGFVTSLPVIVLALIAVLIHLRHSDRTEAAGVEQEAAGQAELAAVRAELAGAREAAMVMQAGLEAARGETAEAVARAEALARKLAANPRPGAARKRTRKPAGNETGSGSPEPAPVTGPTDAGGEAPEDLDSEARVLWYLDNGLSASKAGIKAGLTDGRGRQIARLRRPAPAGGDEGGSQ
jgi:hypothetical protein